MAIAYSSEAAQDKNREARQGHPNLLTTPYPSIIERTRETQEVLGQSDTLEGENRKCSSEQERRGEKAWEKATGLLPVRQK